MQPAVVESPFSGHRFSAPVVRTPPVPLALSLSLSLPLSPIFVPVFSFTWIADLYTQVLASHACEERPAVVFNTRVAAVIKDAAIVLTPARRRGPLRTVNG